VISRTGTRLRPLESAWSLSMMSTGGCRPRWPSSAKSWRDQMFALASLTDFPGRLRLIQVSANKTSAWSVTEARLTREGGMHSSITRGEAREAASYVSANNSALYAGSWNARTLTGRPTWSASRKRRGWRAPIPAGLRVRAGRERRRLVARVAAGRRRTAVPPSGHAGSCREGSSFHVIGHICRGPDCSARSGAFARVGDPYPSAPTNIC
jgi:hypothetical protein